MSYFTFDVQVGHEPYEILSVRAVTSSSVLYSFCISRVTFNIHGDNATYEMQLKDLPVRTLPGTRPNLKFSGTRWAVCTSVFNLVWLGIGSMRTRVSEWPFCLTPNMGWFTFQSNILRISLLRSITAPDAEQDQGYSNKGKHKFSWAVKDTSLNRMFQGVRTKRHVWLL